MKANAYHSGDSEADNSQTPWWVVSQIQSVSNVIIGHDVCATASSAKSISYWTKDDDSLKIDWQIKATMNHLKYAFFMNPPFSLAKQFTTKAADEALKGCVTIGCVKHAPDADWFQEMEKRATFIYVPDGRIQFLKADGSAFMREEKKKNRATGLMELTGKMVRSGANFPLCFPLWTPFNNGGEAKQIRFKRDQKGFE